MGKTLGVALIACVLAAPAAYARQDRPEAAALRRFEAAVERYVALHRDVERQLPALEISPDAGKIQRAIDAMADAMRAARPDARAGDVFDPEVGDMLRVRIRETLRQHRYDPAEILGFMNEYDGSPEPDTARPTVNGRFSWTLPAFMVPCLFEALPALPQELEYRFVDRDLFLVDVHANLVVDVLEDAFPSPAAGCTGTCI